MARKAHAKVLDKTDLGYAWEYELSYKCPHCREDIIEVISSPHFYGEDDCDKLTICDYECPECGEEFDLIHSSDID